MIIGQGAIGCFLQWNFSIQIKVFFIVYICGNGNLYIQLEKIFIYYCCIERFLWKRLGILKWFGGISSINAEYSVIALLLLLPIIVTRIVLIWIFRLSYCEVILVLWLLRFTRYFYYLSLGISLLNEFIKPRS